MQFRLLTATLAALALLSACGGGGGSGGDAPPNTGASAARVTASNYEEVARTSYGAADLALTMGSLGSELAGFGAVTGALQAPQRAAFAGLRSEPMRRIAALGSRPLAVSTQDARCSGGGLIRASFNDANNNQKLDAGDSVSVDFLDCVEDGERTSGKIAVTVRSASDSAAQMDLSIQNFSSVDSQGSSSGDGTMSISVSLANGVNTTRIEANQLVTRDTPTGKPAQTQTLSGFLAEAVTQTRMVPMRTSVTLRAQVSDSALGSGTLSLTTDPAFMLIGDDDYPSSGVLFVRGASNSALRLAALSNTQVRLDLDANGDGTFETSVTKRWSDLD